MNLSETFLQSYELCSKTASPDYCRDKVAGGASFVIDTYLTSYDFCKNLESSGMLKSGDCLKAFSADVTIPAIQAWIFVIGVVVGASTVAFFKR
jgi:hypothetical protein